MVKVVRWLGRAAVLGCVIGGAARAGSLDVNPVRIDLSARQRVVAVTVRNASDQPTVLQLQPQAWSQRDGIDDLVPTDALLATPPIFTLAPGATQIVRVGQRLPPDAHTEQTYRLILQEVPPPPDPSTKGLRMALRISVPVFVVPAAPAHGDIAWNAATTNGKLTLTASNTGDAHVRLAGLALTAAGAQTSLRFAESATYVLPHTRHTWVIDAHVPSGTMLRVTGHDDASPVQAEFPAP